MESTYSIYGVDPIYFYDMLFQNIPKEKLKLAKKQLKIVLNKEHEYFSTVSDAKYNSATAKKYRKLVKRICKAIEKNQFRLNELERTFDAEYYNILEGAR
jgi:pyruvate/2-oxoacid:ferredoxin oxidoreductase alpha subunit